MPPPVVLLTGATSGIGRAAAGALVDAGVSLVVHGRSARRVTRTLAALRHAAPDARTWPAVADLSRLRDVDALATRILDAHERLDVLILNAAVVPPRRELTPDGFERQFAVNHLAPFLLTNRLLPLLRRSAPSRVVVVASQLERNGRIVLDDLQSARDYDPGAAYANSKLANVLFTRELARRLTGSGVTANCLHPGIAGTTLLNALSGRPRWLAPWTRHREPDPVGATAGIVRLALDPSLATTSGAYFLGSEAADPSAAARDTDLARTLWRRSALLVGLPEVADQL